MRMVSIVLTRVGQGLATIALIASVSACAAAGQASSSTANAPTATPVAMVAAAGGAASQTPASDGTPGRGARAFNQAGTVQSVSGTTVTVQRPQNAGTFTVQLGDSTAIRKQSVVAVGDVKSGTPIVAIG